MQPNNVKAENQDQYLEYGVDFEARTIFLYSDIEDEVIHYVIKALIKMDRKEGQITIYLNSYGGSVYEMFGLYDVITKCRNPISTIVVGKVMSAAVLIAAAGDKKLRFAYPNSTYMIHDTHSYTEGNPTAMKHDTIETKRITDLMINLLGVVSNKDTSVFRKIIDKKYDTYLTAIDALELGLVDEIL